MSVDVVVGLLTLLGIFYVGWSHLEFRRSETTAKDAEAIGFSAEAIRSMTISLMQTVETLASRDKLIAELRARVEVLEEQDRVKTERITDLERKIAYMEEERQQLIKERDALADHIREVDSRLVTEGEQYE